MKSAGRRCWLRGAVLLLLEVAQAFVQPPGIAALQHPLARRASATTAAVPSSDTTSTAQQLREEAEAALAVAAKLRQEAATLQDALPAPSPELIAERQQLAAAAREAAAEPAPRSDAGSLQGGLAGARYLFSLDIGREKGTWMPPQWGASGARLELDLLVEFGPSGAIAHVTPKTAWVDIKTRGLSWTVDGPAKGGFLRQSTLRFAVETSGATRGDVSIPPGALFFSVPVWGSKLSRNKGMVTVRQKRWGVREESRILGVFAAQSVE